MECDLEVLLPICRNMLKHGSNMDEVLLFLRQQGCSKIECIKVLFLIEGHNLREAKQRVHFSPVWSDVRQRDEAFQESVANALMEMTELENIELSQLDDNDKDETSN